MVERTMLSGARLNSQLQNRYVPNNVAGAIDTAVGAVDEFKRFKDREKELTFQRLNLEASTLQEDQLSKIGLVDDMDKIDGITKDFASNLNKNMSDQKWGKEWLEEKGSTYLAYNNKDVMNAKRAKEKELNSITLNKTLQSYADSIAGAGAADKAFYLAHIANKEIDKDEYLTPSEKQKIKNEFTKRYVSGMVNYNTKSAISLLSDGSFKLPELTDIERQDYLSKAKNFEDAKIKKEVAEYEFAKKVEMFNKERELSEQLDDLPFSEAISLLDKNEAFVSSKYYSAKQKALLSSKGISADTRADTALEIIMDVSAMKMNKSNEIKYLSDADNILAKIEDKYANGELSLADKKRFVGEVYKGQSEQVEYLKVNDTEGTKWWWPDFTYEDANKYITDNVASISGGSKIMLEYFRQVQGQDLDNSQKKKLLTGLVNRHNNDELNLPSFSSIEEAEAAFESGGIKKGDKIYVAGVRGTI